MNRREWGLSIGSVSVVSTLCIPLCALAQSEELLIDDPPPVSMVESVGREWSISNSEYRNITVTSNVSLDALVESVPERIMLMVRSASSSESIIRIDGLEAGKTYHYYHDSYTNHKSTKANNEGSIEFTLDTSNAGVVFLQEVPSTKFIRDDATGGDCASIGTWDNAAKTCTLNTDVTETIEIQANDITLDGGDHLIEGSETGNGVYVAGNSNISIQNLKIKKFTDGIFLNQASAISIANVEVTEVPNSGIRLLSTVNSTISDVTIVGSDMGIVSSRLLTTTQGNRIASSKINNSRQGISIGNDIGSRIENVEINESREADIALVSTKNMRLRGSALNSRGIVIESIDGNLAWYIHDIDASNTVQGKPFAYYRQRQNQTIDASSVGQILCVECNGSTISNATISNTGSGVVIVASPGIYFTKGTITENTYGVRILSSTGANISESTFNGNTSGLMLAYGSNDAIVENNIFASSTSYAIIGSLTHNHQFRENTFKANNILFELFESQNIHFYHNNFLSHGPQGLRFNLFRSEIYFSEELPTGGNYWADHSCPDLNSNLICDLTYSVQSTSPRLNVGEDHYPWVAPNAWKPKIPPVVTSLFQRRQFGIQDIAEGGIFVGNEAVLGANVEDPDSSTMNLEIELKPTSIPFDGSSTTIVSAINGNTTATSSFKELIPIARHYEPEGNKESFHWRVRGLDRDGNTSEWVEFGQEGNTDFSVRVVPLWTQRDSSFPTREIEDDWSRAPYATGLDFDCGNQNTGEATVADCGCAISSLVMLAHYYGIDESIAGTAITPGTLNEWLKANNGYIGNNYLDWSKAEEFLGEIKNGQKIKRLALDLDNFKTTSQSVVDGYLEETVPVIAFDNRVGHYFLLDSAIHAPLNTYTVRDPFWYNTQTLSDIDSTTNHIRDYNNSYTHATIFTKAATGTVIAASGAFFLASPAEILITDLLGRKTGKDPRTGVMYEEIPGSQYVLEEPVRSREANEDSSSHNVKALYLPVLEKGRYRVEVIGTDTGTYNLYTSMYDDAGSSTHTKFTASTIANAVTVYTVISATTSITVVEKEDLPELFTLFRKIVRESTIRPLIKVSILASIELVEILTKNNKTILAKATIGEMQKLIARERGRGIPVLTADKLLVILTDIRNEL